MEVIWETQEVIGKKQVVGHLSLVPNRELCWGIMLTLIHKIPLL